MSRRPNSPEHRPKRRLSRGETSPDKRSRSFNSREDPRVSRDPPVTGLSSNPSAFNHGTEEDQPRARKEEYTPTVSSSPPPSSPDEAGSCGPPQSLRRPASSSGLPRRSMWATDPRDDNGRNGRAWAREDTEERRSRSAQRDSHEYEGPEQQQDLLSAPRGNYPSRGITPPGSSSSSYLASGGQPQIKTQAAFVGKLYSMLEDEKIAKSGLLYWSADGTSFVCPNPTEFSKEVLPNYFKHNNWQSFVRQLNMYSFNKVSDLYSTANSDPQAWEFRHNEFKRGEPQSLAKIKRKSTRPPQQEGTQVSPGDENTKVAPWATHPGASGHAVASSYRFTSPARDYPTRYGLPGHLPRPMSSEAYDPSMVHHHHNVPPAAGPSHHVPTYPPETSHSEPPYYPHLPPSRGPSQLEALASQVASLQDTVHSLRAAVHAGQVESAQNGLDLTGSLLRVVDSMPEIGRAQHVLLEMLHRQRSEFMGKLESLHGREMLPNVGDDRRGAYEGHHPSRHALHPRQMHTARQMSPRDALRREGRPATSDPGPPLSQSPRVYPVAPVHPRQPRSGYDHLPPPMDPRDIRDPRESHHYHPHSSHGHPRRPASLPRRDTEPPPPRAMTEELQPMDFDPPKTSLRNLLH